MDLRRLPELISPPETSIWNADLGDKLLFDPSRDFPRKARGIAVPPTTDVGCKAWNW
jgi:hypothetical protein